MNFELMKKVKYFKHLHSEVLENPGQIYAINLMDTQYRFIDFDITETSKVDAVERVANSKHHHKLYKEMVGELRTDRDKRQEFYGFVEQINACEEHVLLPQSSRTEYGDEHVNLLEEGYCVNCGEYLLRRVYSSYKNIDHVGLPEVEVSVFSLGERKNRNKSELYVSLEDFDKEETEVMHTFHDHQMVQVRTFDINDDEYQELYEQMRFKEKSEKLKTLTR